MSMRLISFALLAAVLAGCGQGPAPTGRPVPAPPAISLLSFDSVGRAERRPLATPTPTPAATPTPTPTPVTDTNA